jgi:hypothetical protein
MKKTTLRGAIAFLAATAALVLSSAALAQSATDRWFAEINRDIWLPFMEGVASDKERLYLAVRSKDYVRVQARGRVLLDHADYVDDTIKMMARYREQGARIVIDVRFEERIVDGKSASERGISRVSFKPREGEARISYGRFHTISRKEGDRWRVLTEYFAAEPATEKQFLEAKAPDDVSSFRCYLPYPERRQKCD